MTEDPIRLVAEQGQQAPGLPTGVTFTSLGNPSINDSGQIAFHAFLTGPGITNANSGSLWMARLDDSNSLHMVARDGDASGEADGSAFDVIRHSVLTEAPILNDAGQLAFRATLRGTGVDANNNDGLWLYDATLPVGQRIRKLMRENDLLSAYDASRTGDVRLSAPTPAWRFANGGVAVVVSLSGTDVKANPTTGIVNSVALLAGLPGRIRTLVPNDTLTGGPWLNAVVESILAPTTNNNGQVAFYGGGYEKGPTSTGLRRVGAFRFDENRTVHTFAWSGQPAHAAPYAVGAFSSGGNLRPPYLSASGAVSLFNRLVCDPARLAPGDACRNYASLDGIFTADGSGLRTVSLQGDDSLSPLASGARFATHWTYPMNATGTLASLAWLLQENGVTSADDNVIGMGTPSNFRVIAREGMAVPARCNGNPCTTTATYFDEPMINNQGKIILTGGVNNAEGLWLIENGTLRLLAQENQNLKATTWCGVERTLQSFTTPTGLVPDGTGNGDGQGKQFNNQGQLALLGVVQETNGYGIFAFGPVVSDNSRPVIHLNFDDPYAVRYLPPRCDNASGAASCTKKIEEMAIGQTSVVLPNVPSPTESSYLSDKERQLIRKDSLQMLCNSGLSIPVTLEKPAQQDNVVTVYFTPFDSAVHDFGENGILEGHFRPANEYEPRRACSGTNNSVDRYNRCKTDQVIVIVNRQATTMNSDQFARYQASTVLHEAGHAFGAVHINPYHEASTNPSRPAVLGPDNDSSIEIMDYTALPGRLEKFTNQDPVASGYDMRTVTPPWDNVLPGLFAHTHNPVYHLSVWALGVPPSTAIARGIKPGTWDVASSWLKVSLRIRQLPARLYRFVALEAGSGGALLRSFDDTAGIVKNFGEIDLSAGANLSLQQWPSSTIRLLAATTPDGPYDVALTPIVNGSPRSSFENLQANVNYAGNVVSYAQGGGQPNTITTFNLDVADAATIDSDGDQTADANDNCTQIANADQRDTDGDGYGNLCDADLNNNGIVNNQDLALIKARFLTNNADADLDGNGLVNNVDLAKFKALFLLPPGPSGLH